MGGFSVHLNIYSNQKLIMSIENEYIDIAAQDASRSSAKYCVECGAKMLKITRICPACGETQV
jgi:predicted amidophosphoribosyltransferase